jgi:dihydrofolate reductase
VKGIDVYVIGRGTFEKVLTFPSWTYTKKIFVLSNSIKQLPGNLKGKAAVLSMNPKELLAHLSTEGFSNIYIDGGVVIQSFLKEDRIDDMIITRVPVPIGNGIPLFGNLENDLQFCRIKTTTCSNGLVSSRY